jgi:hypothetical protein
MVNPQRSEASPIDVQRPDPAPVELKSFGRHEVLQITLDNETVGQLRKPKKFAHVRDESGNIVGVLNLMSPENARSYQQALETVDFDELDRRADDPHAGFTFEQVQERLRQIEQQESECASR